MSYVLPGHESEWRYKEVDAPYDARCSLQPAIKASESGNAASPESAARGLADGDRDRPPCREHFVHRVSVGWLRVMLPAFPAFQMNHFAEAVCGLTGVQFDRLLSIFLFALSMAVQKRDEES